MSLSSINKRGTFMALMTQVLLTVNFEYESL